MSRNPSKWTKPATISLSADKIADPNGVKMKRGKERGRGRGRTEAERRDLTQTSFSASFPGVSYFSRS